MATPLFRVIARRPDGTEYTPLASGPEADACALVDTLTAQGETAEAVRLDAPCPVPMAWTYDELRQLYDRSLNVVADLDWLFGSKGGAR